MAGLKEFLSSCIGGLFAAPLGTLSKEFAGRLSPATAGADKNTGVEDFFDRGLRLIQRREGRDEFCQFFYERVSKETSVCYRPRLRRGQVPQLGVHLE